ncbi:hypothetical protein R3P38DRAFT_2784075 [Favolaschia claudopus]|uniref:F-box domain-containing protein n=1 Tax=Favolaschia claudopus TaxID=2862362 RepID=A0AAW0AXA2_9AGAR
MYLGGTPKHYLTVRSTSEGCEVILAVVRIEVSAEMPYAYAQQMQFPDWVIDWLNPYEFNSTQEAIKQDKFKFDSFSKPRSTIIPAPTYTTPANLPRQQLLIPSLVISHVCRRWRYLVIATVWSHFTFFHHPRWLSYPLSHLEEVVNHFLTRIPPTRPLDIQLLMDGETPPGSVASFVFGNRERLSGAELELGEEDLREFWRLGEGEGVFPVMRRLKITFVEGKDEEDGGPEPEEGRTSVSRMAPRLTSFSYTAWEGDVDPFVFGLDFERLEELELCATVLEEGIYTLLPRLAEIRTLGLVIDAQPYEEWHLGSRDEDAQTDHLDQVIQLPPSLWTPSYERPESETITIESLTHLDVTFANYEQLITFLHRVRLPALTSLTIRNNAANGTNDPDVYNQGFHDAFLSWFRRCATQRTRLELYEIRNFSAENFTGILDSHLDLTDLKISCCFGNFWNVFASQSNNVALLPNLALFSCSAFSRNHVDDLIAFIGSRSSNTWVGAARLKQVDLRPAFWIEYKGSSQRRQERMGDSRLLNAAKDWHQQGVEVVIACGSAEYPREYNGVED